MASATVVEERLAGAAPPREWWQVWAQRRAQWWAARPALTARWARARAIGLWVALVWLLGLFVFMPDLRLGLRAYLGSVWVVVAWWALARTKTLTWSGFMRFFAACLPWSIGIGLLSMFLSTAIGETVSSTGANVVIAGVVEEALKLVPIALVALLAPRRAARFATVDWALLGVASGTAFLAVEEGVRRVYLLVVDNLGTLMARLWTINGVPEDWIRFQLAPVPTSWQEGPAGFGGHAVMTAIVTGLVGLALVASRSVRGRGGITATAVRVAAVGIPLLALVSAAADHAGYNVQNQGAHNLGPDGTPLWLDPATSTIPWWIRVPWSWLGHGHGRPALFVLIVVVCLLVDASRLSRVPGSNLRTVPRTRWVHASRDVLPHSRTHTLARAAGTVLQAAAALVWLTARDLREQLAAHTPQPGQKRWEIARRAAVVPSAQRAAREVTYDALAAPVHPGARRAVAGGALAVLLLAALVLAPRTAANVGMLPFDRSRWLAGVMNAVGDWWHDQPVGTQILIGAGIAAAIALSGGSLALAFGVSGVLTWGLDKSHGIATWVQDPEQATRDYFATATPAQLAADTVGAALTFAPTNFAGAAVGRGVRTVVDDVIADPAAWMATRRAMLADRSDVGAIDMDWLLGRKPVPLADGSVQPALSAADEAAAVARYEALPRLPVSAQDDDLLYQLRIYGDNERRIDLPEARVQPDGFTSTYGALGDAKHVGPGTSSKFYEPPPGSSLEVVAAQVMDKRLARLAEAAEQLGGTGVIEYVTNTQLAAQFLESRMIALGLRGYVRIVP
ncbi:restriction endonuclease fold toxin-2 domain-containing protein [Cellulomonas wangsupingiae]|uniref:restriction endonuclease fold toxin-2 domain-containing protein n=1 Tax=Cellulomonas wangsupingiae TaxID=2968085 RepID=UPI001D0DE8AB|nr:restriction endonuclease fold toxin-2 domain-containing protein [Cellulomonas wangsupingiae]MCM0638918.1 hypothetical protein [Cellulomonas wangsupingiae]